MATGLFCSPRQPLPHRYSIHLPKFFLKPGPGDLWLSTVEAADRSRHPSNPQEEVYCELFLVRQDDPEPNTFFTDQDQHQLRAAIYVPVNSGIHDRYRLSPVIVVEEWEGWRGDDHAPMWASWEPGVPVSFVESRAVVARLFERLSDYEPNRHAAREILEWVVAILVGVPEEVGSLRDDGDKTLINDAMLSIE
ncbi:hypothetical protein NEOLEDRAFT_1184155 [Neolentinus lepideus HHB14362 ss-1]|uniref:Uncharacterized protein n=1 Tax=Neolentinus lepideus HHB14362 ss-1 TaxID=1314782 RepID=A0A165MN91_9AGAM|nr:hypothetical protein NEOLEDRAFT_1184155 [Neolentinus lepideus HHB14362 ss-1]